MDAALNALNEERDHLAIQISLLDDGQRRTLGTVAALRRKLETLEQRIAHYRPAEA